VQDPASPANPTRGAEGSSGPPAQLSGPLSSVSTPVRGDDGRKGQPGSRHEPESPLTPLTALKKRTEAFLEGGGGGGHALGGGKLERNLSAAVAPATPATPDELAGGCEGVREGGGKVEQEGGGAGGEAEEEMLRASKAAEGSGEGRVEPEVQGGGVGRGKGRRGEQARVRLCEEGTGDKEDPEWSFQNRYEEQARTFREGPDWGNLEIDLADELEDIALQASHIALQASQGGGVTLSGGGGGAMETWEEGAARMQTYGIRSIDLWLRSRLVILIRASAL
jgi:hypothetical protein